MGYSPLVIFHICGAIGGLLSGTASMILRKGSRRHGLAGKVFVISMLGMSASGAYMGYVQHLALVKLQMMNFFMGVLTFYLVATAWLAARRRDGRTDIFDWCGFLVALAVGAGLVSYGIGAVNSPTGVKDGYPAPFYLVWGAVALLCAAGDVRMLAHGGVLGAKRVARHLWRMSFAYFIAVMSFFLGKQDHLPHFLRGSKVLFVPPLVVLILLIYWLVRILFAKTSKRAAAPNKHARVAPRFAHEQLSTQRSPSFADTKTEQAAQGFSNV